MSERGPTERGKRDERGWRWEENEKLKCALPWGDLFEWPQIEGMLSGMRTCLQKKGACCVYVSYSVHDEAALLRDGGTEGGESVWRSGEVITRRGAEGWEPNGYFILSIGVCKWKCQSGRKTNESDRRDATSLAERLINCHCLLRALMFFSLLFFWWFSPRPGPAVSRLRVWWWTLSQGNKGIDLRRESMLSSVTYKSGPVKSDFGLEFSNSVSKVNKQKRGVPAPEQFASA